MPPTRDGRGPWTPALLIKTSIDSRLSDFANDPGVFYLTGDVEMQSNAALKVHPSAPMLALTKNDVMMVVVHAARLVASDAIAVKASKNRLSNLEFFSNLTWILPNVAGLDLSGNAVR